MNKIFLAMAVLLLISCVKINADQKRLETLNTQFFIATAQSENEIHQNRLVILNEVIQILNKDPENLIGLRVRASMYIALKEWRKALIDYKHINQLAPSGISRNNECVLLEKLQPSEIPFACYKEASQEFIKATNNINENVAYYLVMYLSGDGSVLIKLNELSIKNSDPEIRAKAKSIAEFIESRTRIEIINDMLSYDM